jgi:hypothetical protein
MSDQTWIESRFQALMLRGDGDLKERAEAVGLDVAVGERRSSLAHRIAQREREKMHQEMVNGTALNKILDDTDEPSRTSVTVDLTTVKSESALHILQKIVPDVIDHFLSKNADYGDQHRTEGLGPRGEFVGIHRKVYKLKRCLWDGQEMNHEGAEQMLVELIGQCLITLDLLGLESVPQSDE